MIIWWIIIGLIVVIYASMVMAGKVDEAMEKYYENHNEDAHYDGDKEEYKGE